MPNIGLDNQLSVLRLVNDTSMDLVVKFILGSNTGLQYQIPAGSLRNLPGDAVIRMLSIPFVTMEAKWIKPSEENAMFKVRRYKYAYIKDPQTYGQGLFTRVFDRNDFERRTSDECRLIDRD